MGWVLFFIIIIAIKEGGWWWAIAIYFLIGWANSKNDSSKEIKSDGNTLLVNKSNDASLMRDDDLTKQIKRTPNAKKDNHRSISYSNLPPTPLNEALINICKKYSGSDYYVLDLIPSQKRENANKNYPTPFNGKMIALIDSTVFGSAINGLAIGEHGISWKNNWATDTKVDKMCWQELETAEISRKSSDILIGEGIFSMAGSSFDKNKTVELLKEMQESISEVSSSISKNNEDSNSKFSAKKSNALLDINRADYDTLLTLPGVGAAEAKRLIEYREKNGLFVSVDMAIDYLNLKPHHAKQWENMVKVSKRTSPISSDNVNTSLQPGGRMID
ncbi:helix-hairpin-helix domain-containing protein [Nitrosomonas sp.]|uniref:ComEA family DNA-binding protein n=1 Tax=Nitrosomonas sp. TaxID=42353 RepID=UPI002630709A|nr:helix-hairpin-helix domain-containing protein [Nitrosomonas sp.]MCW5601387.1 helix-hairpin-helix domain-containing protein [Nitrosomonas sp.]